MKMVKSLVVFLLAAGVLASCKKEDSASPEDVKKANEFKAYLSAKQFQILEYYADKPIDYREDDTEIKAETDLNPYIANWIKDDFNVFDVSTGKVSITQNAKKISTDASEVLIRDFAVGADNKGPFLKFLTHDYHPLTYRLVEFNANTFLVYVDWHSGAKVFTRFTVLQ